MAILRRPSFWFALWVIWFVTLWTLSGRPAVGPKVLAFPHADKILHFGYFFGGAGLLSAGLFFRQNPQRLHWSTIHLLVLLTLTLVGASDEWHQSWFPFRSGNDAGDLTADFLGGLAGTFIFRLLQPKVFPSRKTY